MFASMLLQLRSEKGLVLREVSHATGIDQGLLSKFEKGHRMPTEQQIRLLAEVYETSYMTLRTEWLAEKVFSILEYEPQREAVLEVAEKRIEYLRSSSVLETPNIDSTFQIQLDRIDKLRDKWQDCQPTLQATQELKLKEYFATSYTYESNRIEGNTLTLQETHLVANEGLTIGGKTVVEHLEAINHTEAISYMDDLAMGAVQIDRRSIMDLHRLILKGIDDRNAGALRKVPVRISGSEHEPPQPYMLDKLMEDYYAHYEIQRKVLHPVILAAEMHERLVTIHPFIDGNGRTSRLIMNLILLNHGYTTAILKGDSESRMKYYRSLEAVQVQGDPLPFYHLVAETVEESLNAHLSMV